MSSEKEEEKLEEFEEVKEEKKKSKKEKKKKKIKKKAFLILMIVLVFLAGLGVGVYFLAFPQVTLKGKRLVVLNYKEDYKEKGYKASYLGKDLTDKVKVSGKVNSNKLGNYKIKYKVEGGIFPRTVVRTVSVKDTQKPKLSITKDDAYVCPGSKYEKEEVTATDNYDGDLSSKIKVDIKKTMVTYSVEDSSGNLKKIEKKIIYKDIEGPVITLEGTTELDMCVNEVYKDPGYTALDNCDGNLNDKVEVAGSVDNSLVGEYELTYKAEDSAGNVGEAKRTVRVSNGDAPGVVYLTFDDGPNSGTTDVILDILKEEGVEATFFVTNNGPDELIVREFEEGHTVALHTASHDYGYIYSSEENYFADLNAVSERVKNLTGVESKFIRFPGGASNTVSRRYSSGIMSRLAQEVQNRGYKYFDWNISSGDAGETTDPNQVYANVVSNLSHDRRNIVLMHDIKWYTRDALRSIIRYCKENGYQLRKISNCTEMYSQRINN